MSDLSSAGTVTAAEPGSRSPGRGLLLTLGALSCFAPLATDMLLPGMPALRRSLHTTASLANLTLTAAVLGLALGQIVAGPISDSRGRSGPLRAGLVGFALSSALCAVWPSIWPLIVVRFCQGLCGGAAIVIARAVVRDLFEGRRAAAMFATLMTLSSIAPVIAPVLGGGVLAVADWHGIFWVLAGIGVLQLVAALRFVPETLPVAGRHAGGLRLTLVTIRSLMRDRSFAPHVWSFGLAFCVLFAFISGGSYVFENIYGASAQGFAAIFAVGSLALAGASQSTVVLVRRFAPATIARYGLVAVCAMASIILALTLIGVSMWVLLLAIFAMMASVGVVLPTGVAAAMVGQDEMIGSASALIGLAEFGLGALIAPFVGLGGAADAVPMGIVMVVCGVSALAINLLFAPGG